MSISPEYQRRVKIMREKYKMTYSDIGKALGISRFTVSRIYRKKSYKPRVETQKKIGFNYNNFLIKGGETRKEQVKNSFFEGKTSRGYRIIGHKTIFESTISRGYDYFKVFDSETSESEYNQVYRDLVKMESRTRSNIRSKSLGGYCTFYLTYAKYDSLLDTIVIEEKNKPVNSYYYEKSEGGIKLGIETGLEAYIKNKVKYDNYTVIELEGIEFKYKVKS